LTLPPPAGQNRPVVVLTHRVALVLTLVVMFVAMQTGWACTYADDDCAEEAAPQACSDDHDDHDDEAAPCGPACSDCVGCSGPARALLAEQRWTPMASCMTVALDTHVAALAPEAEHERLDRPPRA
jgi:hypothetical protein